MCDVIMIDNHGLNDDQIRPAWYTPELTVLVVMLSV